MKEFSSGEISQTHIATEMSIFILKFVEFSSSDSSASGFLSIALSGMWSCAVFVVGRRLKFLLWPLEGPVFPLGLGIRNVSGERRCDRGNPKHSVCSLFRLAGSVLTMLKATAPVLSKASRRALTPKRGNKDFYKGGCIKRRVIAEQVMMRFLSTQAHVRRISREAFVLVPLVNTL